MTYGISEKNFELLDLLVLTPLKEQGADVYLFGSRASGTFHSHSDVDLLYKLPQGQELPPGFLSQLREAIDESRFPYIVELVDDRDLASSYRTRVEAQLVRL
jgi:predicted nucleotidyltransferase